MTIADIVTFHSKILNEDRKIYIHVPNDDTNYLPQSYSVLYLLDGEEQMAMVTGQVIYLSKSFSLIPPMIVVGIGNNDRTKDLTPTHSLEGDNGKTDKSLAPILQTSGGGEMFLKFLREELIPYIDQHYKTTRFRALCGHSLGALMCVYTLINHADMFNAYIAISPSLWWDGQLVLRQAKTWSPELTSNKSIFFSDGSEGPPFHTNALSLDTILKSKQNSKLRTDYTYYPKESHPSEPVKATYDAFRFIYSPVYPPEFDTLRSFIYFKPTIITRYYHDLSLQNGYEVKPPEAMVDRLAHYLLSLNDSTNKKDAADLLLLNTKNYPSSWNAYYSLGDLYLRQKDTQKAIANFKLALKMNPEKREVLDKLKALQKN